MRAPGRFVAAPQRSAVRAPVSAEAGLGSPAQRGPGVATEPVGVLAQGCAVPLGVLACPGVLCGLAPSLSASCLAPASLLATRFSTGSVLWRRLLLNTHGSNRKGTAQGCRSIRELHPSFLSHPTPLAGLLHEPSQPCVLPREPRLPSLSITLCAIPLPAHIFKLFFFLSWYLCRCHLWTFLRSDIYIFVFMPHSASCSAYRTSTCAKYSSALPSLFPSPPRSLEPSDMPVPDLFGCFLRWSTSHQPMLPFAILPLTPEQHLVLYRNTCKGRIN